MKKLFISYGLLIFLGFAGAHRFYLNRYYTAALYLGTAGFFGMGIILDFFMIPFMIADDVEAEGGDSLDFWLKIALGTSILFLALLITLIVSLIYTILGNYASITM